MSDIPSNSGAHSATSSSPVTTPNNNKPPNKKRGFPPKKSSFSGNKRPRFIGNEHKVSYELNTLPKTLMTTSICEPHVIHTNTIGLSKFSHLIWKVITKRDTKLERATSYNSLLYCANLALLYRLYSIGEMRGYNFAVPDSFSTLKTLAAAIVLPEPICRLIESIGVVRTGTGITVVPYVPTLRELMTERKFYLDIFDLLAKATGRDNIYAALYADNDLVLDDEADLDEAFNRALDPSTVTEYVSGTARGYKAGIIFRTCDFGVVDGKPEFLVSYKDTGIHRECLCPYEMESNSAQLGAAFGFRSEVQRNTWHGDTRCLPSLHQASDIIYDVYVVSTALGLMSAPSPK